MSYEVLITRRQSAFYFFANTGRGWPQKASAGWGWLVLDAEASLCLDLQKNQKCYVFWLSGPHGISNFDHQSLIQSDLNYTSTESSSIQASSLILCWRCNLKPAFEVKVRTKYVLPNKSPRFLNVCKGTLKAFEAYTLTLAGNKCF